jgi:general secretion pathway protein G
MLKKITGTQKAFTLVEILVVIAIIGLLATIVAASVSAARAKSRDSRRYAEVNTIQKGLELYYDENGSYPVVIGWIRLEKDSDTSGPFSSNIRPYILNVPRDPLYPKIEGEKIYSYQYISTADGQGYKIHTEIESSYASYEIYFGEGREIEPRRACGPGC